MIAVTGGAGFIGSNLVKELLKRGEDIVVIDNFHTGTPENLKGLEIRALNARSGDMHKHWDVLKGANTIFHQGVFSSSPMYKENPWLVGEAIKDFISVLEFARKIDANIVFASTSSLYNGLEPPHREDMEIKVTDFYTEARFEMERLAELYHMLYGMDVVGLRYFSVYGPGERHKGRFANTVTQFLWEMMNGRRPVIYGDGEQTRDFTFVTDVVEANILASKFKGFGIFNVGTGIAHSFNYTVELINKTLGTDIKPIYVENPIKNYVMHTQADTSLAKEKIGFEAKVSLEEGIKMIAKEYGGK